jgi:hypothetical protein
MRIAAILFTLLALGAVSDTTLAPGAPEQVPVQISSLETTFATKGLLIGTVHVYPESLVVTFDSTHITQAEHESGRSAYHLDSMTVGLATQSNDGRWSGISVTSPALTVADSLAERVTFSLGKMRFHIPRRSGESLSRNWLVVTFHQIVAPSLVPREQQAGGTTYAHSSRGIFSGLPSFGSGGGREKTILAPSG